MAAKSSPAAKNRFQVRDSSCLLLIITVINFLSLAACGPDDPDLVGADQTSRTLVGVWVGDCYLYQSSEANHYQSDRFTFTETTYELQRFRYDSTDENCQTAQSIYQLTGRHRVIDNFNEIPNTKIVDFIVDKAILVPTSDELVAALNEQRACDKSDWTLSIGFEIDTTGCATIYQGFLKKYAVIHQLLSLVDNDQFILGDSDRRNVFMANDRPISLRSTVIHQRQE